MKKFITLIFLVCICITAWAGTNNVSEYKLPNGLKLIVKQDHRAPVVISQVWYKVGSSYEKLGETGVSHVLEHMMFRGTKKYGPGVLKKIVADEGGNINAMTSYDFTMYYESLSADKLAIAFKLEADRMHGLLLQNKAFQDERQVVIEEWRMRLRDNPQSMLYERFMAAANIANPYHHMPIGWLSDLQNLTLKNVSNWYHQWYAPNNAIVVVVGDVNPKQVYQLAQKYFGHLTPHATPQLKPQPEITPLGMRTVTLSLPAKLPCIIMGYNVPSLKTAKNPQDAYALEVAAAILDGGDSARIPSQLIRGQQIAVAAVADYTLYSRLDTLFILEGTPAPTHTIKQLQTALLQQIKQLQVKPVSPDELKRIKTQVIAAKIYAKDSMTTQAQELGSLEAVGLPWQDADNYVKNIEAVTPKQIQMVARKYFVKDRLTIGILYPKKEGANNATH